MVTISDIAFALRTASRSTPSPIKLSHAQHLVVAAFGYNSLAAYQASNEESYELVHASHFVPDGDRLFTRAQELKLPHAYPDLANCLEAAFRERLPNARLHASESALNHYLRELVDDFVINHDDMAIAIAETNTAGLDEVYLPFDELSLASLPTLGQKLVVECEGHVSMEVDLDRPYCGHKIDVSLQLILERKGRVSIAGPVCEVLSIEVNDDWWRGDDDLTPKVSFVQALAEELGLDRSETEELVDADSFPSASEDGFVYGHVFDFSQYASPAVAGKLIAKYGSLQVDVPASFFDRVRPEL